MNLFNEKDMVSKRKKYQKENRKENGRQQKRKKFRCGIIYGCESSSGGGKIVFGEHGVYIHGGIFHDAAYSASYGDIRVAVYAVVLPKLRLICAGKEHRIPVALSLRHSQLAGMLRLLGAHHVPVRKMPFLPHLGRWWDFLYGSKN